MSQRLHAFHRGVVMVLGYLVVLLLLGIGTVEMLNKLRLGEAIRSGWVTIDTTELSKRLGE